MAGAALSGSMDDQIVRVRPAVLGSPMSVLIYIAIPMFFLGMAIESRWARRALGRGADIRGYERRDTLASLGMGVGNVLLAAASKVGAAAVFGAAYEHRVYDMGEGAVAWVVLFFAEDLCY